MANTTWNPADRASVTLSNGNLTTVTTTASGVRSIFSATTGKWYWETQFTAGGGVGIGVANSSAVLTTVSATPTNAAVAYNGSTYVNNVLVGGAGITIPVSTIVCIALDIAGRLIWFRPGAGGNWNNSGTANPAAGAGGVNITVIGSPLFALVTSNSGWTGTTNFGDSAFAGAVPIGFTAGFGATVAQAMAMVLA